MARSAAHDPAHVFSRMIAADVEPVVAFTQTNMMARIAFAVLAHQEPSRSKIDEFSRWPRLWIWQVDDTYRLALNSKWYGVHNKLARPEDPCRFSVYVDALAVQAGKEDVRILSVGSVFDARAVAGHWQTGAACNVITSAETCGDAMRIKEFEKFLLLHAPVDIDARFERQLPALK